MSPRFARCVARDSKSAELKHTAVLAKLVGTSSASHFTPPDSQLARLLLPDYSTKE